ncbi:aminoglycoside phosphotransferase family protein [Chloroflexi bacterium TSY]|nr:aminoglycoside phosphotransferase family protein [Chloroflexi bacterium TSY]
MTEPNWNVIEAENSDLSIQSVEKIGEGWSCLGYLVNESQVFKVPKVDCWDELAAEILFLETLGQQLPLATPRPLLHRRNSDAVLFGYAVYTYIPGEVLNLDSLTFEQRQVAIRNMAGFMRTLHDLQPGSALRQILYVEDHRELVKTATRLLEAAETEIVPNLSVPEILALRREFAQHIEQYQQPSFEPCLLHRDFCTDNMHMVNGAISGVIDFGNIVLGDPDIEFAEVYAEHGEAVLLETAQLYGHSEPHSLVEKM